MNANTDRFLNAITGRHAKPYKLALSDMVVFKFTGRAKAYEDAKTRFGVVQRETMGVAELVGAFGVLQDAARAKRELPETFRAGKTLARFAADDTQAIFHNVTFLEAVSDFVNRAPVTLHDPAERTALRIAQLYSEDNIAAFVKSADEAVTDKVQRMIAAALEEGTAEGEIGRQIVDTVEQLREMSDPWSESYARMVFRTNAGTAVTAGRFRQAQDPDIAEMAPAFVFDAVGDRDTRPSHNEMDGVVLRTDNPLWNNLASPLGYNCRCQMRLLTVPQLRRMDRFKDGEVIESSVSGMAGPDEGFRHGGGPTRFIV